jgi:hypothetical protein
MGLEVFVNILGDGVESVAKTPRNGASTLSVSCIYIEKCFFFFTTCASLA